MIIELKGKSNALFSEGKCCVSRFIVVWRLLYVQRAHYVRKEQDRQSHGWLCREEGAPGMMYRLKTWCADTRRQLNTARRSGRKSEINKVTAWPVMACQEEA